MQSMTILLSLVLVALIAVVFAGKDDPSCWNEAATEKCKKDRKAAEDTCNAPETDQMKCIMDLVENNKKDCKIVEDEIAKNALPEYKEPLIAVHKECCKTASDMEYMMCCKRKGKAVKCCAMPK